MKEPLELLGRGVDPLTSNKMSGNNQFPNQKDSNNSELIKHQKQQDSLIDTSQPPTALTYSSPRIINQLPLPTLVDYSPHLRLEFDYSVQEYCRVQSNNQSTTVGTGKSTTATHFLNSKSANNLNSATAEAPPPYPHFNRVARNCKIVVSGDVAVGKTCLVNRFSRDIYTNRYQTTIGVDFDIQRFKILGQTYVLQIWDTAGLERFRCITNSYYRGCQAALLLFDVSNLSTLANVLQWKEEVLGSSKNFEDLVSESTQQSRNCLNFQDRDSPLLFLVGAKNDLPLSEASRIFIREQANKIASLLKAELWFVSAQTGENVNELFCRVAALSFQRCILGEIHRLRFETSTLGASLKEKILQQQRELWQQSSKFIRITKKKDGDEKRSRCINVQCVIK